MIPQIATVTLAAASATAVAASQALAGAGNLTINGSAATGGVATFAAQRRILITSTGDDSGISFTVTGTRADKTTISETITGSDGATVQTLQDFITVTQVSASGAVAADVSVGTSGVGSSPWLILSPHTSPFEVGHWCEVVGTVNYTIEFTDDDPNGPIGVWPMAPVVPTPFPHPVLQGQTANAFERFQVPCWGWRVTVNSGTGTIKVTASQAGMRS